MGSAAVLLAGCPNIGGWDPPPGTVCVLDDEQQTDATAIVNDPSVGAHTGQLVWLETGQTTGLTLTVDFAGPAITGTGCGRSYQVPVRSQAVSADGLIDDARTDYEFVSDGLPLPDESITFALDAASLLGAGVAPDQPDLAQKTPTISLEVGRDASGWTGGRVRAVTADERVTLALISFGGGP